MFKVAIVEPSVPSIEYRRYLQITMAMEKETRDTGNPFHSGDQLLYAPGAMTIFLMT